MKEKIPQYKLDQRKTREALKPRPVEKAQGEHMIHVGSKFMIVNRATDRRRSPNRDFTKPNVEHRSNREYYPFKGHMVNDYRDQREKPVGTNHERNKNRAIERKNR